MSNFLDEAPGFAGEFPFPAGEEAEPETLEAGEKWSVKADCSEWELLDMRGNNNIGDKGKAVINMKARGLGNYAEMGEVAYWFDPKALDNPKHPARRDAAMIGKLLVALGLLAEEQFAGSLTGKDINALLVAGASKFRGKATFNASLVWQKRAYTGNDGNTYHARDVGFRSIRDVVLLESASPATGSVADEDLPF